MPGSLVLLIAALLRPAAAQTVATITVVNPAGLPLPGVEVVAVHFGPTGPDGGATRFGSTAGNGQVAFTLLDNNDYEVFATTQGFAPTLRDVFNSPDPALHRHFFPTGPSLSATIELSSVSVSSVGVITLDFINATPNAVLFGNVNANTGDQVASGIALADGSGAGTLRVYNVPFAPANSYHIGLYDPQQMRGTGRGVNLILGPPGSDLIAFTGPDTADFLNSIPPPRIDNGAGGAGNGLISVEGAVTDTTTAHAPIPNVGLSFQSAHGGVWTQSDANGHFQLFGLIPGDTYYTQAFGGCVWTPQGPGGCFEPWNSPAMSDPSGPQYGVAPSTNDFVYVSSTTVVFKRIELRAVSGGSGSMAVYAKTSSGLPIPNANVNLNPDYSSWRTGAPPNCGSGQQANNPGLSNAGSNATTGYALLTGLPSGHYIVNVWTPFSQQGAMANSGPNGTFDWDWQSSHCGADSDDLRITIDTAATPTLQVFDSSGTNLSLSSITVTVDTDLNQSGEVKGVLRFSAPVDLRDTPATITLYPQCQGPCEYRGGFTVIAASGSAVYPFRVTVSSGTSYWIDVRAKDWGIVRNQGGDDRVNLESSTSAFKTFDLAPAGAITGKVFKPDGTILRPQNDLWIGVNAGGERSWGHSNLAADGSFLIEGLLPGLFHLDVHVNGPAQDAFTYALPPPQPSAHVLAGVTSTLNLRLVNAVFLGASLDPAQTPDPSIVTVPEQDHTRILYGFATKVLPTGTVLAGDRLIDLLFDDKNGLDQEFEVPTSTSQWGRCGPGWPGGFCARRVPSPSVVDMLLIKRSDIGGEIDTGRYLHMVVFNSTRGVVVDAEHATSVVPTGSAFVLSSTSTQVLTASGVAVDLTPVPSQAGRGNATLNGSFIGVNFFRQADYDAIGGDFERFLRFLPVVALYDSSGTFRAAGIVTPSPSYIAQHDAEFEAAFHQGYQAFLNLVRGDPSGLRYAIDDLAPNSCYTEVVSTPNYPPFQRRVCLGANGSTTTVNVNMDLAVGSGATLQGVVQTTAAVPIQKALVELTGEGLERKTAVTGPNGTYAFPGLPAGSVKLRVTAQGFAPALLSQDLSGTQVVTRDVALTAAPGTISGTVYSQRFPFSKVQPGAHLYAYDDTYNGQNPGAPLPLIKTQTDDEGEYTLGGLVPGHVYKVFLKVPGKYVLSQSTTATSGAITGFDFTMRAKPLDIEIYCKPGSVNYECTVQNPSDFKSGTATYSAAPWTQAAGIGVPFTELPNRRLLGTIPLSALSPGVVYQLHAVATSLSNKTVVKDLFFGLGIRGATDRRIDDLLIGDEEDDGSGRRLNEAAFDPSGGNLSSISLPAGSALPVSSAAVPGCTFQGTDPGSGASSLAASLGPNSFVSDIYDVALSSVSINPDKGLELTLAYDKSLAELSDLAVARYDAAAGAWEELPGTPTVNPLKGTVKVTLASLSAASPGLASGPLYSRFDGRQYVVHSQAASGTLDSGTFAVVRKSALTGGDAYAGAGLKVFNVPNPFDLSLKTVALAHSGAAPSKTTEGTVIRFDLPAASGGDVTLRIYTVSGELVRELPQGTLAGGKHYYVDWDGKNRKGEKVANGVYFGVLGAPGVDKADGTFKMAVIK